MYNAHKAFFLVNKKQCQPVAVLLSNILLRRIVLTAVHVYVCAKNQSDSCHPKKRMENQSKIEDELNYRKTMADLGNVKIAGRKENEEKGEEVIMDSKDFKEDQSVDVFDDQHHGGGEKVRGGEEAAEQRLQDEEEEKLIIDLPDVSSTPFSVFDYIPPTQPFKQIAQVNCDFGRMNNFTKGCKWAADGTCLMVCSDDQHLRLFNLPPQLTSIPVVLDKERIKSTDLPVALDVKEGGLVYDYCFNPLMNSNDEQSCL